MTASTLRLRDLAALDVLQDADLVGGEAGLDAVVRDVAPVEPDTVLSAPLKAGSVVLFATGSASGPVHRDHLLDLLLRRAHIARASALLVLGQRTEVAVATRRLADKFAMPTLLVPGEPSALDLGVELRTAVHAPEVAQSRLLQSLANRLRTHHAQLPKILSVLGTALGADVATCTEQGVLVEGAQPVTPVPEIIRVPTLTSFEVGGVSVAVLPVVGLAGVATLWLVAERRGGGTQWRQTAEQALSIAHGEVLAWLAREQLAAERDARLRSTLLTEIMEHGDAVPDTIAEQATMAGWQLGGWHVGVHIRFGPDSSVSALTLEALMAELGNAGLKLGPLVERADGWSTWLTTVRPPHADEAHRVAGALRTTLRAFAARGQGLEAAAGVGAPQRDAGGIASTLAEARQAAVIAAATGEPGAVRIVQDLGASRLLLGWYSSSAFQEYAEQILRPLVESGEPELLTTLETYLDRSCSVVQAGRALGVHRNTVAARIARTEGVLDTSLAQPDTRLALQLALRAVRTGT